MDGHEATQTMMFCMLHQVVEMGYHALLHDVDIAWLKSPWEPLLHSPRGINMDIQGQLAPRWDAHGVMNSGFVLFRSNPKVRVYLRTMVELTPLFMWLHSDQVIYNSLIRHWRFRQIHFQVVPRSVFLDLHTKDGVSGTMSQLTNETCIVHVISHSPFHKFQRMQQSKQWYLNDKCVTYTDSCHQKEVDQRGAARCHVNVKKECRGEWELVCRKPGIEQRLIGLV